MKTLLLPAASPHALPLALDILKRGGLVAFPTDTVYGLAANLFDPAAILRIYDAKGRDSAKAIPVLIGSPQQLPLVAFELPPSAQRLAQHFWPGALTLVVARQPSIPAKLSATPTVGVRMPDHPLALSLLLQSGPLAVTSANLSGAANPLTAQDVLSQLEGRVDLILDGGETSGGVPSTVIDCTANPPLILRAGAISAQAIAQFFASDQSQ